MDEVWEAVVAVLLPAGASERRSRYADKPALGIGRREIAHPEAPGVVDLRVTAAGWRALRQDWGADPAVEFEPGRRDWITLRPSSPADVLRLTPLLEAAAAANR